MTEKQQLGQLLHFRNLFAILPSPRLTKTLAFTKLLKLGTPFGLRGPNAEEGLGCGFGSEQRPSAGVQEEARGLMKMGRWTGVRVVHRRNWRAGSGERGMEMCVQGEGLQEQGMVCMGVLMA